MTRREAREQAFALTFQLCFQDVNISELAQDAADTLEMEIDDYALRSATAVQDNIERIDEIIDRYSTKWKRSRLPKVTLSLLRLAIAEIRFVDDVPQGAIINEAVELAKKYGGEDDPSYVNGVLGGYVRGSGKPEQPEQPEEPEQE